MRVSVAICTHNGQAFLPQQLQSLAAQTRRPDELVVCDDCSSDGTRQILADFAARASFPVRLQHNPTTLGITRNFEQAIRLCDGDLIFLCDQDDVWLPHKIATLHDLLAAHPYLAAAFSDGQVVGDALQPLGYRLWDSLWFRRRERRRVRSGRALEVFLHHNVAAGGTLAFRAHWRELLLPIPDLYSAHDAWIGLLLAAVSEIAVVDEPLIQYRLHAHNHVGLRRYSILQQVTKARQQIADHAFRYAVQLHQCALERLQSTGHGQGLVKPQAMHLLEQKILHSERRDALPAGWLARLPVMTRELLSGRYFRYSYGWKSVAQDLFLR